MFSDVGTGQLQPLLGSALDNVSEPPNRGAAASWPQIVEALLSRRDAEPYPKALR
jgi:hypothetical protein